MSEAPVITYNVDQQVATITMNRSSSMNALNKELRDLIVNYITDANADSKVKSIVIASSAKGFCSGTDLNEAAELTDTYALLEAQYKPVFHAIMQSPKPIIAAVNGACAGIGASLVLACDLVVMSENAFIFLAFAKIGLIPDGGMCWHLTRNLGTKRAFEVIAEGGRLNAQRCKELGLVNRVVADANLQEEVQAWARQLAVSAPLTLKYTKQVLQQAMRTDLDDTMRLEASIQTICTASDDGKEGIAAFLEKRAPIFVGK